MEPARPLLYVTPIVPAPTGTGLAMRSRAMLELLARRYDVSMLIVPLHGPVDVQPSDAVAALCREVAVLPPTVAARLRDSPFHAALGLAWSDEALAHASIPTGWPYRDVSFDVVHVYRLTALPAALPYLFGMERAPARHLDLDEAESETRRRLARFCRANGEPVAARFADLEAAHCATLEREVVRRFDRVYVSSGVERAAIDSSGTCMNLRVVANTIAAPVGETVPRPRTGAPFRFLFVGTLGFPANEDAVVHFCRDILPRLRAVAPRPFEFVVVGAGASARLRALAEADDVRLVGAVPDVTPWYAEADAVVVPLRTGGGTRLKVLEAMSHGRPVISTVAGVDGIDVEDGAHALVAESPDRFTEHCRHLMIDAALGMRLATRARALVRSAHTLEAAAAALFAR